MTEEKDEQYWRVKLTPEQYKVLREKETEPAFSGLLWDTKLEGMYRCAGCGAELFDSSAKYDSGTGWPSFHTSMPESVRFQEDDSFGMHRTAIVCARCGGHLGHVFNDGPEDKGGRRFCINSCVLNLEEKQ